MLYFSCMLGLWHALLQLHGISQLRFGHLLACLSCLRRVVACFTSCYESIARLGQLLGQLVS
jgi:hypothetical protein